MHYYSQGNATWIFLGLPKFIWFSILRRRRHHPYHQWKKKMKKKPKNTFSRQQKLSVLQKFHAAQSTLYRQFILI